MKRILFICDQSPFEESYGAQQRTSLLFNALCSAGQVDLVCFTNGQLPENKFTQNYEIKFFGALPVKVQSKSEIRMEKIINIIQSFSPYSLYQKNIIAKHSIQKLLEINVYDYIVIRYIKNAFMCGLVRGKNIIVDVDDLPEQSILSYSSAVSLSAFKLLQYKFYAKRARFHTDKFLNRINHSFFPNADNCKWSNSSYLPNIPFTLSEGRMSLKVGFPEDSCFNVLFVGYMHHTPNSHGVNWFIEKCWQKIKQSVPKAIFNIAGNGVTAAQKDEWNKKDGINILGFVPDISSVYKNSAVVIVPVFYGSGTNIKVLEAMYFKRACVVSEFASKGYKNDLIENESLLIGRTEADFSEKVIKTLLNRDYNRIIAGKGEKSVKEKYSYSAFLSKVKDHIV